MSQRYEQEQAELAEKIKVLKRTVESASASAVTAEMFISIVRKYTRAKKLTRRMLNELIESIEVHQAEKINGVWEQRLTIHFNCIGVIDIPDNMTVPHPRVTMNTRKGVYVNFQPEVRQAS